MKLVYTSDHQPGYRRIRQGKGFCYRLPDGGLLRDPSERRRIRALAIPPAYQDVWICLLPNGHLQATGIDARGRKQYRYHPEWHAGAADRKFEWLSDFVNALPKIRGAIARQLAKPDLSRERVIAGIVYLLDRTGYRIGSLRYVRENHTFGLASLLTHHLTQERGQLSLCFPGKAGQQHHTHITSHSLARLVADLQDLPGQHLFRYEDASGAWHDVTSTEVNDWLKQTGHGDFTAKQFRTWKATLRCARILAAEPPAPSRTARERVIRAAIKSTAQRLHHTAATCRKYYIHPAILAHYRNGSLYRIMNARAPRDPIGLRSEERRVLRLLARPEKYRSNMPCPSLPETARPRRDRREFSRAARSTGSGH